MRSGVKDGVQAPDVDDAHLAAACARFASICRPAIASRWAARSRNRKRATRSIFAVFPLVGLVMLIIVMFQLQNFTRVGLVMMSAPLGLIGASLALNVAHAPFGFVALLGLIALSGMDMRNSIILVDQVRQDLEQRRELSRGDHRRDSSARASRRADGARRDSGDDSAVALRLLGADGAHHHGRAVRRDLPDGAVPAGALRAWFRRHLERARLADAEARGSDSGRRVLRGRRPNERMAASAPNAREPEQRASIIATAERLFREIGFQKTTVADIARELRMSPANVYRFFGAKSEINAAVARHLMNEVERRRERSPQGRARPRERLRALVLCNRGDERGALSSPTASCTTWWRRRWTSIGRRSTDISTGSTPLFEGVIARAWRAANSLRAMRGSRRGWCTPPASATAIRG